MQRPTMTMNKTSILSDSSSSSSLAPPSSHGLRTQLGHIIPKHALFHVHLHIDQLSNVPLVSGEFGVRWKFRSVQSGAGLLSKMKQRSVSSSSGLGGKKEKGKTKLEVSPEIAIESESGKRLSLDQESDHHYSEQNAPHDQSNGSAVYGRFLTASPPHTPVSTSAAPTITRASPSEKHGEARGMTEWAQLKHYSVRWDHRVDVLVQMDVHRETSDLLPCELKLVAMQRVVHGDPNAPHQPRLGAIYINLAEYAGAGSITRRYLLRESKTNATLKLTLNVEHIGGEKHFTPPPLRKGEIMASVTGILSNNDLYNTKLARNLDIYTRTDDDDWTDTFERTPVQPYWGSDGRIDFDRLASSDGLRTTENLIDAIFNPLPTASPTQSPFTYYDPENAQEAERRAAAVERQSTHSSVESGYTDGSRDSSHSSSVYSASSDRSSNSLPGPESHKHWWQKMRSSRPSTPSDRHFRPSAPQANGVLRMPS